MSEGSFLSRWSRRKLEAEAAQPPPSSPPRDAAESAAQLASPAHPPAELRPGSEGHPPALTAEELAPLPPVDELTPESDLLGFFREGVPEALRKAALRRIWSIDPAIRDYVGDARDYAYDWNTPGGVPSFSAIVPLAEAGNAAAGLASGPGVAEAGPGPAEHPLATMPQPAGAPPGDRSEPGRAPDPDAERPPPQSASTTAVSGEPQGTPEEMPLRRRHGGATPV